MSRIRINDPDLLGRKDLWANPRTSSSSVAKTEPPPSRTLRSFTGPSQPDAQDPFYQLALKEGRSHAVRNPDPSKPTEHPKHFSRIPAAAVNKTAMPQTNHTTYSSPLPPLPPKDKRSSYMHQEHPKSSPHQRFMSADFTSRDARLRVAQQSPPQKSSVSPPALSTGILDAPLGSRRGSAAAAPQSAVLPSLQTQHYSSPAQPAQPLSAGPLRFSSSRRPSTSFDAAVPRETSPLRSQADGTESVISTTAPSTVWDELGELKSRIRKLEIGGNKRRGSTAQTLSHVDSSDRPRTSTTQTTNDTSPFLSQQPSPNELTDLHPLLRQALGKARSRLDLNVYKYLEAVAFDALELAAMTRGTDISDNVSQFTSNTNDPRSERRLKRKADNVCRGLTELSIALCEGKAAGERGAPSRPVSRDNMSHFSSRSTAVSGSFDASSPYALDAQAGLERRPSARLMSRFAARRGSNAKTEYDESSPSGLHLRRNSHFSSTVSDVQPSESDNTLQGRPSRAATEILPRSGQSEITRSYTDSRLRPQHQAPASPSEGGYSRSTSTTRTPRGTDLRVNTDTDASSRRSALSPGGSDTQTFDFGDSHSGTGTIRRSSTARRPPPSAAANLEQRLQLKREQRGVASAQQLGGLTPTHSSPSGNLQTLRRPQSSGHDAVVRA